MKTLFKHSFTFILVLFTAALTAQVGRIERTTVEHEGQRVDALTVNMKPERKDIQEAFDDWMKDRYDIKMKGGGLFGNKRIERAEAVVIPAISADNITLVAKTEEMGDATQMTLFASRGLENYVGKDDYKAFTGLEDVFDAFLSNYLPEYYDERVAEAREMLNDLRKDFVDVEEDIADNEEKIRDLKTENEELRRDMKKLEAEIDEAEKMLNKRENIRQQVKRQVGGKRD